MRYVLLFAAMLVFPLAGVGCQLSGGGKSDVAANANGELENRSIRVTEALAKADSGAATSDPVARWLLSKELAEVSGLALTSDGRLFAHNDESPAISEIDYRRGTVLKQFLVGPTGWHGDFEGLAIAGELFFLLDSSGELYEFREGAAGERVDYVLRDTRLGKECEFEGVAFDSTTNSLLLVCKNVRTDKFKDMLVLYRYGLGTPDGAAASELAVPMSEAIGPNDWKELHPTDITVDPFSGNYVIVAAPEKALLVLTPMGVVASSRPLGGRHPQAEGIAITRDGILLIGDESVNAPATITLYGWP